jgi:phosphopantetheinyl transferase
VDIEKNSRAFKEHPLAIAKRYFHPHEIRKLEALRKSSEEALSRAFLELWMKKEAWGKLTRKGLIHTLQLEADSAPGFRFVPVPVAPDGYSGVACVSTTRTQA